MVLIFSTAFPALSQTGLVISQIYGGGSNTSAAYMRTFESSTTPQAIPSGPLASRSSTLQQRVTLPRHYPWDSSAWTLPPDSDNSGGLDRECASDTGCFRNRT